MARAWLLDGKSFARKVGNINRSSAHLMRDSGATRECPNCLFCIDNKDVSHEWPGFPAGVKFDPTDSELLEHLAAKCGVGNTKPHTFIDEFIPTLDGEKGICYTHPENLPGAKKDGSWIHFFHKNKNAYATGQRKRRKVHIEHSSKGEHVRWHKTGKTKVLENGVLKGRKKIMVLYASSKKGSKPEKSNWVMHQYHLGTDEDEKDSEYVVSKISYQQNERKENLLIIEETSDALALHTSPSTPNPNPPNPPRAGIPVRADDVTEDTTMMLSSIQEQEINQEPSASHIPNPAIQIKDDEAGYPAWWAGESQAVDDSDLNLINDPLLCHEIVDFAPLSINNSELNNASYTGIGDNGTEVSGNNPAPGISDLEKIMVDTPPELPDDLQFNSEDSVFDWISRL